MFRFSVAVLFFLLSIKMYSQCSVVVTSSNGYTVNIIVKMVSVIPSSTNCPNGYNYNVALNYTVTFTGSNIPSSLYTLQGNLTCNSQSLFYDLPNGGGTGSYTTGSNPYISSDGTNIYTTHPSCTAANPTNLNCGGVTVNINGPGINNQTVNCSTSTLPIGLSYFSGVNAKGGIRVEWQTETEKNNDYFDLEKSTDGIEWKKISKIPGAGTSLARNNYSHLDPDSKPGINYYRLKQTDYDARYSYSPVISVLNPEGDFYCSNIWPNPSSGDLNFELSAPFDGKAPYRFINDIGTVVYASDFNFYTGKNEIKLSTENLASGFYLLEIQLGRDKSIFKKIVKL